MSTISIEQPIEIPDDVLFRNIDGEAVLVHLGSGTYFGLDEVGTRVWELLSAHGSLQQALDALLAEYEVEDTQAKADLLGLASDLIDEGLLRIRE